MRTFKKIITVALVLSMLATLFVPMSVSAAASKSWTKTSELWYNNSNTELSAVKTATKPTIDGVMDNNVWNNAQPLVLNSKTYETINNAAFTKTNDVKIYMLYDDDNLYILQDVPEGSSMGENTINILPEKTYVKKVLADATAGTVPFDGFMPRFAAGDDVVAKDGTVTITNRRFVYNDNNMTTQNGTKETGWTADANRIAGLSAKYSGSKSGGYKMEIQIAWTAIGCTGPTNFGVKFLNHISAGEYPVWYGGKMNHDCIYHDPVEFRDSKGATPKYLEIANKLATPVTAFTNTNQLFNPVSNTDLGFYKATSAIAVDGTRESVWDNAVPLVLNAKTATTISTSCYNNAAAKAVNISFMYNNNGVYILEENQGGSAAPTGDFIYNFMPEKAVTLDDKFNDGFIVRVPVSGDAIIRQLNINNATFNVDTYFNMAKNPASYGGTWVPSTGEVSSCVKAEGANGYVREIFIPWTDLGYAAGSAPADGDRIGVRVNPSDRGSYHMGGINEAYKGWTDGHRMLGTGVYVNQDIYNYDPATLRTSKPTTKAPYLQLIDDATAMKTKWDNCTVLEIGTAAELKAFNLKCEMYGLGTTAGKTIKLTADIDLNPGVDWSVYTPERAYKGLYQGTLPSYRWIPHCQDVEWTWDGQGHSITGFWIPDDIWDNADDAAKRGGDTYGAYNMGDSYSRIGLLGGRVPNGKSGGFKNIVFGGSYVQYDKDLSGVTTTYEADGVTVKSQSGGTMWGFVVGEIRSDAGFLENLYFSEDVTFDLSFDGRTSVGDSAFGAVAGRVHDGDSSGATLTVKNIVWEGKVILDTRTNSMYSKMGAMIGILLPSSDVTAEVTDVMFTGDLVVKGGATLPTINATAAAWGKTNKARVYDSAAAALADSANAMYLTRMEDGSVLPVAIADMISGVYMQFNDNTKNAVRFVSEIDKLAWDSFGYQIKITSGSNTKSIDTTANTCVFKSVTAGGNKVDANSLTFNKIYGTHLYAVEFNNIPSGTYTFEITPVWKEGSTTITGATRAVTFTK